MNVARSAWLPWLAFALAAALPAAIVIAIALRAAGAERARAREDEGAAHAAAVQAVKRGVDTAFARGISALRAIDPAAPRDRVVDALTAARPAFADVVVVDADGALVIPPPPPADAPPSEACLAARTDLLRAATREDARRRILAECTDLRSDGGRYLWPLLALEQGGGAGDALAGWIDAHAARLSADERRVLRARVVSSSGGDEAWRTHALASLDRATTLNGTLAALLADTTGDDTTEGDVHVHRGRALVALRALAGGGRAGYVAHVASLSARGAAPVPAGFVVVAGEPDELALAPKMALKLAEQDPAAALERARVAGRRVLFGTFAVVAFSVALAAAVFARARRAQRLAELRTDFVAAVSHELRTPLASVRMLAELLEQGDVPEDERAEVERTLAGESRRLARTLERMLRFGALSRGKLTAEKSRVAIAPVVRDAAERFRAAHAELPRPVVEADEELEGEVDAGLLGLALDNLLSNAAKYAPEGGPYRVRARPDARDLVVSVSDRGPGLDARARSRVFLPFERDDRLSRATEGTGVGLALVRGIARAHGGDATVESEPGKGATFVLRLPRSS